MTPLALGCIAGVAFGALSVALMIPIQFPDKRAAMLGAFVNRFGIGFLIPLVSMPGAPWLRGLAISLLLSLPSAIITKAWAPILIVGAIGGSIIGWLAGRV
jgi:hypothetical protein